MSEKISATARKFILHWGEMGSKWGINRAAAQTHALLYLSPRPLNAEEIAATLSIARSSVSACLRELQGWGVVKMVHVLGDRRAYFEALQDAWEMFRVVSEERKRREIDPTLQLLQECVKESGDHSEEERQVRQRLADLVDVFQTLEYWYRQITRLPTAALRQIAKTRDKVGKLFRLNG